MTIDSASEPDGSESAGAPDGAPNDRSDEGRSPYRPLRYLRATTEPPQGRDEIFEFVLNLIGLGVDDAGISGRLGRPIEAVRAIVEALKYIYGVERRVELIPIAVNRFGLPRPWSKPATLSSREREIVDLVVTGLADKQIAYRLGIKIGTVRTHLDRVKRKTGLRRRADLIASFVPRPQDSPHN